MSRVRNLVDFTTLTHDFDGDGTLDFSVTGTVTSAALDSPDVPKVDLTIAPEILEIQVAAPAAGQDTAWLWTWLQSTLPYARREITNSPEAQVPLYLQGTYTVNNYAAYDLFDQMTQTHSLYLKWIDGAGTDNLIDWATSTGPVSDSHPDINSGNATDVQRINISVPSSITLPTLTAPSVSYTVTNNGSGAYTFSGAAKGDNPQLGPFYRGGTYTFNVSAVGHPFYFTTDNGTNFSAGTYFGEYTDGVTGSRSDSGTVTIVVPSDAPDTLYYQCGNHSAMRGAITVKDLAVETNNNGNYIVYFQHTQEGHKTPVELRPIPSLVNQMCIVYDANSGKFVPQDLATYVENTPSFENKIREVAGTAELVVEDGSAVVAKVNVYYDSTYLPLVGNNAGDQAFATDNNTLYVWDGSAWQPTKGGTLTDINATGDVTIGGNLTVNGTTTTINSTSLSIDDLNITLASGAADSTAANGAGITVDGANASLSYNVAYDQWELNKSTKILSNSVHLYNDQNNANTYLIAENTGIGNAGLRIKNTDGEWVFIANDRLRIIDQDANIERMSITSSGKVGIGATQPDSTLLVYGEGSGDDTYSASIGIGKQRGPRLVATQESADNDVQGLAIFTKSSGNFSDNPVERVRISNSGNVGIGTADPNYKLQVNGDIDILNLKGSSGNAFIRFTDGDASADWSIGSDDGSGGGAGSFIVYDRNASAYRLAIKSNGNVGISTPDPDTTLDVRGSGQFRLTNGLLFFTDNDTTGATNVNGAFIGMAHNAGYHVTSGDSGFGSSANSLVIGNYHTGGGDIILATTNSGPYASGRVIVKENGDVGIGTDNPGGYKLRVNGDVDINGNGGITFDSGDAKIIQQSYGLDLQVYNSTTAQMETMIRVQDGLAGPAFYNRGNRTMSQSTLHWNLRGQHWNRVAYIDHRRAYEIIVGTHGGWFGPGHRCIHMSVNYSGAAFGWTDISSYNNYWTQVRFTSSGNGSGGGWLDIYITSSYNENGPTCHIRPLDGGYYSWNNSQELNPGTLTYVQTTSI